MHHVRKIKTFKALKKNNQQDLMKQLKNQTLLKIETLLMKSLEFFLKLPLEVLGYDESQASSFIE